MSVRQSIRGRMLKRLLPFVIIVLIIGIWEGAVWYFSVKEYLLPAPSVIAQALYANIGSLSMDLLYSALESVVGFLVAIVFSFAFAVFFAHSRTFYDTTMPFLIGLKAVPIIAMAPLLILWFGNGFMSKAVMAALICFFPIVVNLTKGLIAIPDEHIELMRSLSASWWQILFKIRLPNSMPYFVAALKIASTLSVVGAIVAEFSGANKGIGYVILVAALRIDTPMLFCGIFMAALLGITLYYVIEFAEKKLIYWETADVSDGNVR